MDAYIDYVSNPLNEWRQPSEYLDAEIAGKPIPLQEMALTYKPNPIGELIPIVHNLPKPNREITKIHFMTLLHQLYIRGLSNEQGWFALSTVILQKQYRYYNYMLNTLQFKMILERSGSLYRLISPETFHPQKFINKKVEEDLGQIATPPCRTSSRKYRDCQKCCTNILVRGWYEIHRTLQCECPQAED